MHLDDSFKDKIRRDCEGMFAGDKMSPEARENYRKKLRQEIEEIDRQLAETDNTGVDWDAPSDGWFAIGKTEFAEDEYDPSISAEQEEELIAESEEFAVDSGYLTEEELRDFFSYDDDVIDTLHERTLEGHKISQELFGVVGTENLSHKQINTVRRKLGLGDLW